MIVRFTVEAEDDLEHIADYIARDNPRRALTFVRDLRAAAEMVGEFPQAYPLIPRYESTGVQRKPYRDYLIFYVPGDGEIYIVHVLHGAQDYEAVLFPE